MERTEIAGSRGATALRLELPDPGGGRLVLELPAVAGRCRVRLDGDEVAALGPSWTTLRLPLDGARAGARLELAVEPADDAFAGFLPEVDAAPRGLWQGAFLRRTGPACFLERPHIEWHGDEARLETAWNGPDGTEVEIELDELPRWSPAEPAVGRMKLALRAAGARSDEETLPAAARALDADGERLLLDGAPFRARGLLHWGLYPGLAGPDPEPDDLREELRQLRARGFNLLKCCLWLPPQRFLDVCDELGMPVWLEYPLWKQPLTRERVDAYGDFLAHDAAHPCVVLRSFSCENDDRDAEAACAVAALVRRLAPGTLCADNSGWLGHAHVADFHDEHPYLHNAQWPHYLDRLRTALDDRPAKPLLLGETMVADALADGSPLAADADQPGDSRRLAMAARRFQAESFVRAFPDAGYVICGASDAPAAPLGLRGAGGAWKDPPEAWAWQAALAEGARPAMGRPAEPGPAPALPEGVRVAETLDAALLEELRSGARVLHLAGPRAGSWRTPEALYWSWVPVLGGPAATPPLRPLMLEHLPFGLLSGRRLARHPGAAVIVGLEDLHDAAPGARRPPLPLVLAARVGRGRLVVSGLRADSDAGRAVHAQLARALLAPGDGGRGGATPPLPEIELAPPPPSHFLDGPWEMNGRRFATGTLLANGGANSACGAVTARGRLGPTGLPPGPATLHATAVADGWELYADGQLLHRHGNPGRTWDAGRDLPAAVAVPAELMARAQRAGVELEWRLHDHRGAGVLIGPVWLVAGAPEAAGGAGLGPLA